VRSLQPAAALRLTFELEIDAGQNFPFDLLSFIEGREWDLDDGPLLPSFKMGREGNVSIAQVINGPEDWRLSPRGWGCHQVKPAFSPLRPIFESNFGDLPKPQLFTVFVLD